MSVDKDTVRRFRNDRGDPYGGLLCVDQSQLTGVSSTSGTTGDPTLVPEQWGGGGLTSPAIITRDLSFQAQLVIGIAQQGVKEQ